MSPALPQQTPMRATPLTELKVALKAHGFWFSPDSANDPCALRQASNALGLERIRRHQVGKARCVTVDAPLPGDAQQLSELSSAVLVCPERVPADSDTQATLAALERAGLRVFFPHGSDSDRLASLVRHPAWIGRHEFLCSDAARLAAYPALGAHLPDNQGARASRTRMVAILDLLQDFEILQPFIVRAAADGSPFDLTVSVADRVVKSHVWSELEPLLRTLGVAWFTPIGPIDVSQALGPGRSVLLMASESSARAHSFCHQACKVSPPGALRVSLQHGFECIGLRHHRAHERQFSSHVRFASDMVLTWSAADDLPDLHPLERDKCIAVGVTKSFAELAAACDEAAWHDEAAAPSAGTDPTETMRLLIAENLHSIRFSTPTRYQRFLQFVEAADAASDIDLTIRAHPAARTLEKIRANRYRYLTGSLRPTTLAAFDAVVSAPSTLLLDAAMAGAQAAVWSEASGLGDCANYKALPVVTDIDDVAALSRAAQGSSSSFGWAVDSTAALNGIPTAWAQIVNLA